LNLPFLYYNKLFFFFFLFFGAYVDGIYWIKQNSEKEWKVLSPLFLGHECGFCHCIATKQKIIPFFFFFFFFDN